MRYAAFIMGFILTVASFVAHGSTIEVKGQKGSVYSDLLKRSCNSDEWKVIEPFLSKIEFDKRTFPKFEFELADSLVTSKSQDLKIEYGETTRVTIAGKSYEGTACSVIAQLAKEDTVAKFNLMDLVVSKAEARDVLETETPGYVKGLRVGGIIVGGALAIAAWGVPVAGPFLSGAAVAATAGAVGGDLVARDIRHSWNRQQLEQAFTRMRADLRPVSCTQRTVVLRAAGGREVTLTRGSNPEIYIKNPQIEGRLRGSFSATAKSMAERWANKCFNQEDVAKLAPAAPPQATVTRMIPPPSLAPAPPPPVPHATSAATAVVDHDLDNIDGLFDTVPSSPTAVRRTSN